MIAFEHTEVLGVDHAIRGMRNPMNSWEKSDSVWGCTNNPNDDSCCDTCDEFCARHGAYRIGPNDHDLMMRLAKGGPVHAKYRRMVAVYVDITAPLYWWKEFDMYKVGTVANSCSTMHKITAKRFTPDDFSHEHLLEGGEFVLNLTIDMLNLYRRRYFEAKDMSVAKIVKSIDFMEWDAIPGATDDMKKDFLVKRCWWQMIQLLPSSYNQRRTIMLNYEVLAGIYPQRKNHKLDEWREFCKWIEELPYSEIIIGGDK